MTIHKSLKQYFTDRLVHWHETENKRSLPWKQEKDPYKIWLSEIILQQTRAEQGLPYYLNFTSTYPTIIDLANAPDEETFRLWQGLGYYNRCKNMLFTARQIASEYKGKFPSDHDSILSLKGIGPYTAAAISSFAYGLPHAVVDGNVYRVLSRFFGIDTPFDSTAGKKEFSQLAQELLYTQDSAGYNQAIMDLGATVCTPKAPNCSACPLQAKCIAKKQDMIALLPVKSKKTAVLKRYFHYILFISQDHIWIRMRTRKDIWQNLHEPFLIEDSKPLSLEELANHQALKSAVKGKINLDFEGNSSQRLTHRQIEAGFFTMQVTQKNIAINDGKWVHINDLKYFGFPKTIVSFLEKKLYF